MFISGIRFLFIGAHPDDIEIGCGGILHQLAQKSEVLCLTLSDNQKNPKNYNLMEEHYASMNKLGIKEKNIIIGPFETRRFSDERQDILEFMYQLNMDYRPDIVFVHSPWDYHQDHEVVAKESLRAFRSTVLGYEILRSTLGYAPSLFIEVSEEDISSKMLALSCYNTYAGKRYFDPKIQRAILLYYGALADSYYAEGFFPLRMCTKLSIK